MKNFLNGRKGQPVDLFSEEARRNPYQAYEKLRHRERVFWDRRRKMLFVHRYDDVKKVLAEPNLFSSQKNGSENSLIGADGIVHRQTRKIIQPAFSRSAMKEMSEIIADSTDVAMGRLLEREEFDAVRDIAMPVSASVYVHLTGHVSASPETIFDQVQLLLETPGTQIRKAIDHPLLRSPDGLGDPTLAKIGRLILELSLSSAEGHGTLTKLVRDARTRGILGPRDEDGLGQLLLVAVNETVLSTVGFALYVLATRPALREELRSQPSVTEKFVEEILRWESPVQRRPRVAREQTSIGGRVIDPGTNVVALIGAANRDPSVYSHPELIDLNRDEPDHLAFGIGPHRCIGAHVAVNLVNSVVTGLLDIGREFELDPASPPPVLHHPTQWALRGPRHMPLRWIQGRR